MKGVATAIGLAILLGSSARAEESTADLRAVIDAARASKQTHPLWVTGPVWTRKPNGDDIFQTYPEIARAHGVRGGITLTCRIGDRGELKLCVVDHEEPSGKGFGEAALKLARIFRMKDLDQDGMSVSGRLITLPIIYRQS